MKKQLKSFTNTQLSAKETRNLKGGTGGTFCEWYMNHTNGNGNNMHVHLDDNNPNFNPGG